METFKCVIIGDGAVGKTCMLVAYTEDRFPGEYAPTVFDTYTANLIVDEKRINLSLWDTAGQEDFEKLRPLSYSESDVFVICYAIPLRSTFENVKAKWIPEILANEPKTPYIIVGTKVDTREENKDPEKAASFVSKEEAQKLVNETQAYALVECSALKQTHLKDVFEQACKCVLNKKKKENAQLPPPVEGRRPSKRKSAERKNVSKDQEQTEPLNRCGCFCF